MTDKPIVAVKRTKPETVLEDIRVAMAEARLSDYLDPSAPVILKDNISWHFPFLGANTTPWQLEGVILALKDAGYEKIVCVQNETVVTNAGKGERLNKYVPIFEKYKIPVLYNFKESDIRWIKYTPKAEMRVLNEIFPDGMRIPEYFTGEEHNSSPHSKVSHLHRNHRLNEECVRRVANHQATLYPLGYP